MFEKSDDLPFYLFMLGFSVFVVAVSLHIWMTRN